ncbi:QWRF motif-containing protein 2-like [Phragmites australis]|uniref:QWRF motif-containing protein 2-like n=1 Tax=Phragmites australis TaxID=29695 RepID=UPI002D794CDA|nr:QWRF motif-containing protein 2-like [Phragmites australis]
MVAAGAAAAAPRLNPSPSPHHRRAASALSPAKSNANAKADADADARPKAKAKAVSSRYLLGPSSKSTSTSTSTSTTTTSSSNSTSTSASTPSRRFASPLPRRSVSVDRPRPGPGPAGNAAAGEAAGPNAGTTTTTRSLSVAFQGRSFSFETSKAKPATSPSPARRPVASVVGATTPERRRPGVGAVPERGKGFDGGHNHHRWPVSAKVSQGFEGNSLTKSLDCSLHKRDAAVLSAVRSLRQSMVFEEGVRCSSFDGGDYLMSSDTDSVSSGSNSGSQDAGIGVTHRARLSPKGMSVPARFFQDAATSRSHRFADPGTPYLTHNSGLATSPRTAPVKKSLLNGFVSSSSPLNRPIRQPSPSKLTGNPSRRTSSPSRVRNSVGSITSSWDQQGRSSSGYGLDGEVRRRRHGGSKADREHLLRILSNRHLQWRCVNAQADAALAAQKLTAEKYLCDAWITTLGMRKSVALKRFQLQLFRNNWKLMTVLKGQMAYLEEWSLLEGEHADSLSGIVEALTATILCLPVTDGAKADIQDVKNAVASAVDIMQTIGNSICTLLSKLAGTSILVSDLAKVATEERTLMEQSRELLSTLGTMHVKYCSLEGQRVQTTHRRSKHS